MTSNLAPFRPYLSVVEDSAQEMREHLVSWCEINSGSGNLSGLAKMLAVLKELSNILGIFLKAPQREGGSSELLGRVMQLLIDLRTEARANKNFATADAIRDGIGPLGITLEDRAGGTEWTGGQQDALDGVVNLLIELRQTARSNKDFATADTIRDRLTEAGVTLEDRSDGTDWNVAR